MPAQPIRPRPVWWGGGWVPRSRADWRLFGFARIDTVAGGANKNSPLVRQTTGATVGLGVSYTWMRSSERARD